MTPVSRRATLGSLVLLAAWLVGSGAAIGQAAPRPDNAAEIKRIESYLNDIRTLRSQFLQIAQSGETAEGTLLLKRPGKMKLDYPNQMILASGTLLTYYDKEAKQTSHEGLQSSLAGILVRPDIRLTGGDIKVTGLSRAPGVERIRLVLAKDSGAGSITLVFSDRPLELRQWIVVDPQGQSVQVTLEDAHFGVPIDDKEFYFVDPNSPIAPQLEQR